MKKSRLVARALLLYLYADIGRRGHFTVAGETRYEVSRTPANTKISRDPVSHDPV